MLDPERIGQELKHFIPSDFLREALKGIRPFEDLTWHVLKAKIIVKSFDTTLDIALKAKKLFNSDKELYDLNKDLQDKKAELELDLNRVLNIHPAQTINFNQSKKILEIQESINQIERQLQIINKIREESHITRRLKNFRSNVGNTLLGVVADMVSPSTKPKNR